MHSAIRGRRLHRRPGSGWWVGPVDDPLQLTGPPALAGREDLDVVLTEAADAAAQLAVPDHVQWLAFERGPILSSQAMPELADPAGALSGLRHRHLARGAGCGGPGAGPEGGNREGPESRPPHRPPPPLRIGGRPSAGARPP